MPVNLTLTAVLRYDHIRDAHDQAHGTSRRRALAGVFVSQGIERALALARSFDMPMQLAALERVARPSATRRWRTIVPLERGAAVEPTPLELATMVRDAMPGAREGIDFVVVWSPASRTRWALACHYSIVEAIQSGPTTYAMLTNVLVPEPINRGDAPARFIGAYQRFDEGDARRPRWQSAAAAFMMVARAFFRRDDVQLRHWAGESEFERHLRMLDGCVRRLWSRPSEMISSIYGIMLGRRQALFNFWSVAVVPRAQQVFVVADSTHGQQPPPHMASNERLRAMWAGFFEPAVGDDEMVALRAKARASNVRRGVPELPPIAGDDKTLANAAPPRRENGSRAIPDQFDEDEYALSRERDHPSNTLQGIGVRQGGRRALD